ncbi:MAG: VWA domain-containing protein [Parachlamydiaceae bacterium]
MIPRDLAFSQPMMGLLLLLLPFFAGLFYLAKNANAKALSKIASKEALVRIAITEDSWRLVFKAGCFCLFWLLATLALMRPVGNAHYEKKPLTNLPSQDVIFLLDTSLSMGVVDSPGGFSRFDYAKEMIEAIAKKLNGYEVMLATFAGDATLVVPQTQDVFFLRLSLKDLELNEGVAAFGTDFIRALESLRKFYFFDTKSTTQALVILSDGGDTILDDLPAEQRSLKIKQIEQLAKQEFPNALVYGIGLGTSQGGLIPNVTYHGHRVASHLETSILSRLSRESGGKFFIANEYTPQSLAESLVSVLNRATKGRFKEREALVKTTDEFFQLPLFFAILFFFLFLFFPSTSATTSLLLLIMLPCCASEDFLIRYSAVEENFETAIQYYHRMRTMLPSSSYPIIDYNLGTIALLQGKFDEAIELLKDIQWSETKNLVKCRSSINMALAYQKLAEQAHQPLEAHFNAYQAFLTLHAGPISDSVETDDLSIKQTLNQTFSQLGAISDPVILLGLVWSQLPLLDSNFDSKSLLNQWMSNPNISFLFVKLMPFDHAERAETVSLAKEKIQNYFSSIQMEKRALLDYLLKFYSVRFDPSFIELLQQKLTQQNPDDPDVIKANQSLELRKRAESDRKTGLATFQLLQAKLALQLVAMREEPHSVKRALQAIIAKGKNLLFSTRTFLQQPSPGFAELLKPIEHEVLKEGQNIFKIVRERQALRFSQGICQCLPWNKVIPLLKQAITQWEIAPAQKDVYDQLSLQKKAIQLWEEALKLLAQSPEGPLKEQKENELLSDLQEMQSLDKQPVPIKPIPQEGKFW